MVEQTTPPNKILGAVHTSHGTNLTVLCNTHPPTVSLTLTSIFPLTSFSSHGGRGGLAQHDSHHEFGIRRTRSAWQHGVGLDDRITTHKKSAGANVGVYRMWRGGRASNRA